jgi:hypothetical protein
MWFSSFTPGTCWDSTLNLQDLRYSLQGL